LSGKASIAAQSRADRSPAMALLSTLVSSDVALMSRDSSVLRHRIGRRRSLIRSPAELSGAQFAVVEPLG
jgi:hypothetical protein